MFSLPQNILTNTYNKPDIYLCEVDDARICKLNTTDTKLSLKFNSLSELSFNLDRTYIDTLTGEKKVHMHYDRIEHPRQILVSDVGYFQIQGPDMSSDGLRESKTVTAYSSEYALSQKYITNLRINTGEVDSAEVIYSEEKQTALVPVSFYNSAEPKLSLLNIVLEDIPDWKIGHIDPSLTTLSRKFDIARISVYDFLMNEACKAFNCYIVFDTLKKEINFYAEATTAKFLTGKYQKIYTVSPPMDEVCTVSIDGYKTTKWMYRAAHGWQNGTPSDSKTANSPVGTLVLVDYPGKDGLMIEVVEKSQSRWETDVFITFDNLSNEMNVSYNADDIITKLTVTYGDDLDIRAINMGSPYIMDLSYFYTVEWMGQDLYDAYTTYLKKSQTSRTQYEKNSQEMVELSDQEYSEEHRLSMNYIPVEKGTINSTTTGTYYITDSNGLGFNYYKEVTLPDDYSAYTTYYVMGDPNINPEKVSLLYEALKENFMKGTTKKLEELTEEFAFMDNGSSYDVNIKNLIKNLSSKKKLQDKEEYTIKFLKEMWNELGRTPLKSIYLATYKTLQSVNIEWAQKSVDPYGAETYHDNYPWYFATLLFVKSIESCISDRETNIKRIQTSYDKYQQANIDIANSLILSNNFTEQQLIRLNAFIKEDELHIDDIIETECDTLSDSFKLKQAAMEAGRIELNNRCKPKLQFSATMANIYAIPGFKPIIHQFQLGNVIRVGIRKDYIKNTRLLQVDINLDYFSDFSVEFGELTDLRTQSDIHADLLAQAISAGKTVASSEDVWNSGVDVANSIDLKIQNGLLDAATEIRSMNGTQNTFIDQYGIHLQEVDSNGAISPEQGWICNNKIIYSDDAFQTARSVFGKYKIRGESGYRWGLLSDACISGYIEGSILIGGEMKLGPNVDGSYNFTVDPEGHMIAQSADVVGKITASSGAITGDLEISGGSLLHKNGNYTVQLRGVQEDPTKSVFHIEEKSGYTTKYPFRINGDGSFLATKGTIGGWSITDSKIYSGDKTSKVSVMQKSKNSSTIVFATGGESHDDYSDCPFRVTSGGNLYASKGEIGGWSITDSKIYSGTSTTKTCVMQKPTSTDTIVFAAGGSTHSSYSSSPFYVKADGYLFSSSGKIGGFDITKSYISNTKKTYSDANDGVYIGTNGIGLGKGKFHVTSAGKLTATDAVITGEITSTEGTIGGWTIGQNMISGKNGVYEARMSKSGIGVSGNVVFGVYNGSKWVSYIDGVGNLYTNNATVTGTLQTGVGDAVIKGKIVATSGSIGGCEIEDGVLKIENANIGSIDAEKITAGTITADRIEGLPASKITSGTFATSRIPSLDADKITSGTLYTDGDVTIKTSSGATFESWDDGLRIYSEGRVGYFTVYSNGTWLQSDSSNYMYQSAAYGTYIYSDEGTLGGSWYTSGYESITSDENKKNTITEISHTYENFFDNIGCYTFKFNDGTSDRLHCGFISQRIKDSLDTAGISTQDFGGLVIRKNEDDTQDWYIRYDEFIPLNTWQIQKLKTRVSTLEDEIKLLKQKIEGVV